jgi:hypothetical protein
MVFCQQLGCEVVKLNGVQLKVEEANEALLLAFPLPPKRGKGKQAPALHRVFFPPLLIAPWILEESGYGLYSVEWSLRLTRKTSVRRMRLEVSR